MHAYGKIDGKTSCDDSSDECDTYVKFILNNATVNRSETHERTAIHDVNYRYVSDKIPKTSTIKIQVYDDDSVRIFTFANKFIEDDLLLETEGTIDSFLKNPFRSGAIMKKTQLNGQNSINTYVFWEDEYEYVYDEFINEFGNELNNEDND